ncbi:MAG: tetratricopeptide repeat protein [Gammaproteobacteria bacterium]|jgi:TolB-like protein/thioredoxin-like negative regulator of GroEL
MSFIDEIRRRNVARVGVLYVVAAWLLLQVTDVLSSLLPVPVWTGSLVFILLVIGFPLVLIFSWIYELTPEGIKREKDVDRSQSVTGETGRKINILIIVLLVLAIATVLLDRFIPHEAPVVEQATVEETEAARAEEPADPAAMVAQKFAPPADRSVAVLPFVNMSGNPENEYFSDGLTEELLNVLAKMDGLRVAARTSSFRFKGEVGDPAEIGEALNVNHLLEGSVRQSGDRIRITAQLINASDGYHLWSETYDRTLDDVFAIQDEISRAVASALEVRLLGGPDAASPVRVATRNMAAYNAYLKGTQLLAGSGVDTYRAAEALFEEALRLDPDFAAAHAGLARAWVDLANWGTLDFRDTLPKVQEQIDKALAIDPQLPDAWVLKAWIRYWSDPVRRDRAGTAEDLRQALELEPGNVRASEWLAFVLAQMGERDEAVNVLEEAIERDPLSVALRLQMGAILEILTRFEEAEANYNLAVDLAPDDPNAVGQLAEFKTNRGQVAEAVVLEERLLELDPLDPEVPAFLWLDYLHMGDDERAEAWVTETIRRDPEAEVSPLGRAVLAYYRGEDADAYAIAMEELSQTLNNRLGSISVYRIMVRDIALARGDLSEAEAVMEGWWEGVTDSAFAIDPELDSLMIRLNALPVIAARNGRETAQRIAADLLTQFGDGSTRFSPAGQASLLAYLHGFLGDPASSVRYLRQRDRIRMRDNPWFWYERNSLLAPIADTAEFRAFMSELEAAAEEQLRILRASGEEPPLPQA